MDRDFDEADQDGETDEVSAWYEFGDAALYTKARGRWSGRGGGGDWYRRRVPGVDYVQGWREARAAELLLLAVCERHLAPLGLCVRTETLVTGLGVGVVRCEIPAAGFLVIAELIRDGERFRALVC